MKLAAAVVFALVHDIVVHHKDATEPDRLGRLTTDAVAMITVANRATCFDDFRSPKCRPIYSDRVELLGAMIVEANHEANWRYDIQIGNCGRYECDPYLFKGEVFHAAKGLWQGHRNGMDPEFWAGFEGLEAWNVERAAWDFTWRFAGYYTKCGGLEGAFSGYARGGWCHWEGALRRGSETRFMTKRLRMLLAKPEPES